MIEIFGRGIFTQLLHFSFCCLFSFRYDRDRDEILRQTSNFGNETVPSEDTQKLLDDVESNRKHYQSLFDPEQHHEAVERGDRRLS